MVLKGVGLDGTMSSLGPLTVMLRQVCIKVGLGSSSNRKSIAELRTGTQQPDDWGVL